MREMKRLEDMNLTDKFLFGQTMEYKEAYEALVSIVLDEDVRFVNDPKTEKELRVSPKLREVRLDVLAKGDKGKMYYTEMQKNNTYNLIKRSRYYQAQMDVSLLEPGEKNFNRLNSTCMVLIAPFDIFGKGFYRYTFEGVCRECPELKLNDGALRVFINTRGKNAENFSEEFLELMKYIENSTDEVAENSQSSRVKTIHEYVKKVKLTALMNVRYLHWWEEMETAKEEAKAEGMKEGKEEGMKEGKETGMKEGMKAGIEQGRTEGELNKLLKQIISKLKKNHSPEVIAEALEEDVEYTREVCEIVKELGSECGLWKIIERVKNI